MIFIHFLKYQQRTTAPVYPAMQNVQTRSLTLKENLQGLLILNGGLNSEKYIGQMFLGELIIFIQRKLKYFPYDQINFFSNGMHIVIPWITALYRVE